MHTQKLTGRQPSQNGTVRLLKSTYQKLHHTYAYTETGETGTSYRLAYIPITQASAPIHDILDLRYYFN